MTRVRKAIIPAAGLGTRFLPATKSQAKEMIPVVDKPGIQYVVEEAVRAGLTEIVIVTSRGKAAIEDHFDRSPELEAHLAAVGKEAELEEVAAIAELADIAFLRQKEPRGFGHAVLCARALIGREPFAVLVGDEIVPEPISGEQPLLPRMIEGFGRLGGSVLAVQEAQREDIPGYGIVEPSGDSREGFVPIRAMVEKPRPEDAPSNLASRGRYVFDPFLFDVLESTPPGVGGEIQLTDAIAALATARPVYAYVHDGPILDVGKKLDYLKATVQLALRRDDLAVPFADFLRKLATDL